MNLGKKILELRKEKGITQNELAEKLFVSYQAVSQWENGNTNPDVSIIPAIAEVFNISIDELFSITHNQNNQPTFNVTNYEDNKLYILIVEGKKIHNVLDYDEVVKGYKNINFVLKGNVKDIKSHFSVTVEGDVSGDIAAGDGVNCGNVRGSVTAGDGVNCGNVGGAVTAGDGVNCNTINGDVEADTIECHNIKAKTVKADTIKVKNPIVYE